MPLSRKPLPLEPDPRAVRDARQWVRDILESLGRDDLVDSAQLAVSELVTNAVLHALPPITVSVRGTRDHPRVEVHDHSEHPPLMHMRLSDDDFLMSTIGRGIGIVACYSSAWGADLTGPGKTVWFEPASEPENHELFSGDVFDLARVVAERATEDLSDDKPVTVRLLDFPVQVFADFRVRYEELRRELRLLSLAHGEAYPLAHEFSELTVRVEQERRLAAGTEVLERAIARGDRQADLEYHVPETAPATMGRLLELLDAVDEFCRQERMLAVAASPQQRELRRWYLSEFVRQGAGEEPTPWWGSFAVEAAGA